MPIRVELYFMGLFMFVERRGRCYALLPRTDRHSADAHHDMPPHMALLLWVRGDGVALGVPLAKAILSIAPTGHIDRPKLPLDLADASKLTAGSLPPRYLETTLATDRLHARVDLGGAWDTASCTEHETFDFEPPADPPGHRKVTAWVNFAVTVPSMFGLELKQGDKTHRIPFPDVKDGATIRLLCVHLPVGGLLGDHQRPSPGDEVKHFHAYYDLFDNPEQRPKVKIPKGAKPSNPGAQGEDRVMSMYRESFGPSTQTCPSVGASQ